jgi:hypothetical protein
MPDTVSALQSAAAQSVLAGVAPMVAAAPLEQHAASVSDGEGTIMQQVMPQVPQGPAAAAAADTTAATAEVMPVGWASWLSSARGELHHCLHVLLKIHALLAALHPDTLKIYS